MGATSQEAKSWSHLFKPMNQNSRIEEACDNKEQDEEEELVSDDEMNLGEEDPD